MKILIVRFSSIGDIVLTTPIIRCAKKQYPDAEIHYLTKKKFEPILTANPYLTKIHTIEDDAQPIIQELVKEEYTYLIDLHNNIRTLYVKGLLRQAFNSRIQNFTIKKLNFKKWLLTTFKINLLPPISIVDRSFECVKKINILNDNLGLDYFIAADEEIKKDDLPTGHSHGFIACAIGGQHNTKKMPLHKWKELCEKMDYPLVLLGGKEDTDFAEELKKIDPIKIYNACGKYSINESADIVRRAKLLITHDTGLMHIAAAFKKKIISIWGNTVPAFGMYPYYGNNKLNDVLETSVLMEVKNLSCRPCSKIGYEKCPKKHFRCMNDIPIDELMNKAKILLAK